MDKLNKNKYTVLYFFAIAAGLLVLKAAQLQVFDTSYREQARRATLDQKVIYPSRGLIYDRNKKLLVTNTPIYEIHATYRNIKNLDTTLFCKLLDIDKATLIENLNKDWSKPQFHKSVPFVFMSRITSEQFALFQEHLYKFSGFEAVVKNIRSYPHTNAAHILGYLGEVNQAVIDKSDGVYTLGDYAGVKGVERVYEEYLRGDKGMQYVLKDNLGREVGSYDEGRLDSMANPGVDLMSSIDLDLQAYVESLMVNKRGSVVAVEPSTGEILALVSAPTFDPNLIALDKNRSIAFDSLLRDSVNKPFFDRSVMALYPPGSIFKPVMALIALEKGVNTPNRTIYCDGAYELDRFGRSVQKCHSHPTPFNVSIAIQHSCNSYFYQTIRDFVNQYGYTKPGIGLDTLVSYLYDFGLGKSLESDISSEGTGFVPDSKHYDRMYRKEVNGWRATYMLSLGIGQGELQVTTLQMANLAAIIANRGFFYTPHLIRSTKNGGVINPEFTTKKKVRISPQYFEPVITGMEYAVSSGTAVAAYNYDLGVCGKTGTSENPFGKDHSVFFGFAPRNNPKIAIAVYVENAGWGGEVATPIAGLTIEKYLKKEISPQKKYLETKMLELDLINPINPNL